MKRSAWLLLAAATVGCGAQGNRPGMRVLPDMADSVPWDAYAPNPLTPDGKTLLLPPEGTVPVGFDPFPYGPGPEEAVRAGRELVNPLEPTPEELKRGAREYANMCLVCHGPNGDGDGPIIGRFPNPPSYHAQHARELPDGQLYHIITRGQGLMPPHAAQVLPLDRWRLVLHIRELQAADVTAAATPGTPAPEGPEAPRSEPVSAPAAAPGTGGSGA